MTAQRLLLPISVLGFMFTGCGEAPNILAIVKAGKLPATTKPIGEAFDHAFPGGTWEADMSGMGEMYAHFRSSATAEALEASGVPSIDRKNCAGQVQSPCRIPVSFDFTLAPDYHSISLAEVKAPEAMKSGEQLDAVLAYVYR